MKAENRTMGQSDNRTSRKGAKAQRPDHQTTGQSDNRHLLSGLKKVRCANTRCNRTFWNNEFVWVAVKRPGPKTIPSKVGTCPNCGCKAFINEPCASAPLREDSP